MKAAAESPMENTPKILLIDDDQLMLERHQRVLAREGFNAECASSGEEALGLIESNEFDAIVSDIAMPGMSGTDLLREVRARNYNIPVILATGAPSLESAVEAVELGAMQYLVKPLKVETLRAVVSRAVLQHQKDLAASVPPPTFVGGPLEGADRATLEETLTGGIEQLWMAYQPIVRWPSRELFAYEALVRTRGANIPHPGVFFDLAEHLNRVQEVGRAVRRTVARDFMEAPPDVSLFVNLHALDLKDEELFSPTSPLSLFSSRVVLEVTERTSIELDGQLREQAAILRRLGYRLAVDDLGSGYAGLTSLAHLDPEVVKIDMSMVRNILSSFRRTCIRTLIRN